MSNLKHKKNNTNTSQEETKISASSNLPNLVAETNTTTTKQAGKSLPGLTYMFNKKNYTFMLAGLALIAVGFILMSGGKSADPNVFNKEEIYSFRRITLAPILVMAGFILEIYAIMRLPKEGEA
jgi:hypothetical protein